LFNILFFIGNDCKTERVGIRIRELAFKQPFENEASSEFKNLESSLLSAVSSFKHVINWHEVVEGSGIHARFASQTKPRDIHVIMYLVIINNRARFFSDTKKETPNSVLL